MGERQRERRRLRFLSLVTRLKRTACQKSLQSYMVQLHILEAVLELFFLACPAANKRHKRQLINRAVPNLAVTTFLVGGSPLHPSFLFGSLHSVGRLEKIGRADEHADLGVDLAVECVSSSGVHIMSNCVGWRNFKAASIARACAGARKKRSSTESHTISRIFSAADYQRSSCFVLCAG